MFKPTPPVPLSLILTRIIRAPRSRVFQAFASVEELQHWFGPGKCHVIEGDMEFQTGGFYRLTMFTTDFGNADLTGEYTLIIPDDTIHFTWRWEGNEVMEQWGTMTVQITLHDHSGGTEITIHHQGFIAPEVQEGHQLGWSGSFDKLKDCFGSNL